MKRWLPWLAWPVAALLVVWALRGVAWSEVGALLSTVAPWQWLALFVANAAILLVFSGRWWIILWGMGKVVGYLALSGSRLAGFAVSYFTPGTQFGGEPLQVHWLTQRGRVPMGAATASVALDRALEVMANATFLAFGLVVSLRLRVLQERQAVVLGALAGFLLLVPLLLLGLWLADRRPMRAVAGAIAGRWGGRWAGLGRLSGWVEETETELVGLCRQRPAALLLAMAFSLVSFLAIVAERWLMLRFLGVELDASQSVAVVTASRLAFLLPLPGALGALEASQILALEALGLDAATGAALALVIRLRDVFFGVFGLGLAWHGLRLDARE